MTIRRVGGLCARAPPKAKAIIIRIKKHFRMCLLLRNVGGKVGLKENLGWGHSGSGTTAKTILSIDVGSLPCQSSYSNGDLMFFDCLGLKKAEFFKLDPSKFYSSSFILKFSILKTRTRGSKGASTL